MPKFLEHSTTSWKGQRLKHGRALIDSVDPRARILISGLFALVTVSLNHAPTLCAALLFSASCCWLAQVNLKRTLRRVIAMDGFMIFLLLLLPFTYPGEPLFTLFSLPASYEGLEKALTIMAKANAIVLVLLTLVGTMDAPTLGHALAKLRVPEKLIHLMLFTVRYLEVINHEYKKMRQAMRARAFIARSNLHTWRSIGYLFGMLLIRSLERAERILKAMKCRGFRGQFYLLDHFQWQRHDSGFVAAMLTIITLMGGGEIYLAGVI